MEDKKIQILELLSQVYDPMLEFFDIDSDRLLDLKIQVLTALKEGKSISEIPRFLEISPFAPFLFFIPFFKLLSFFNYIVTLPPNIYSYLGRDT